MHRSVCNNRGIPASNASSANDPRCVCQGNFASGGKCDTCKPGWYGSKCDVPENACGAIRPTSADILPSMAAATQANPTCDCSAISVVTAESAGLVAQTTQVDITENGIINKSMCVCPDGRFMHAENGKIACLSKVVDELDKCEAQGSVDDGKDRRPSDGTCLCKPGYRKNPNEPGCENVVGGWLQTLNGTRVENQRHSISGGPTNDRVSGERCAASGLRPQFRFEWGKDPVGHHGVLCVDDASRFNEFLHRGVTNFCIPQKRLEGTPQYKSAKQRCLGYVRGQRPDGTSITSMNQYESACRSDSMCMLDNEQASSSTPPSTSNVNLAQDNSPYQPVGQPQGTYKPPNRIRIRRSIGGPTGGRGRGGGGRGARGRRR